MKTITISIAVVALLNMALLGAGYWAYDELSAVKDAGVTTQAALAKEKEKFARAGDLEHALAASRDAKKRLDAYMFDATDEDALRFVKAVEGLARIANVEVTAKEANFVGKEGEPPFHMVLSLEGDLRDIQHMFLLLESFPSRLRFVSFSVSRKGETTSSWDGKIELELRGIHPKGGVHAISNGPLP